MQIFPLHCALQMLAPCIAKIFEYYKTICTTVMVWRKVDNPSVVANGRLVAVTVKSVDVLFFPTCNGYKSFLFTKCGQNAFDACIQQKCVLQYYYHKECARDSPFDRTATCFCKVPKAERWEKQIYSPSDDGLFCCLFVEYTWSFFYETNHSQSRKSTATCLSFGHSTFKGVQKRTTTQQKVLFSCCSGGLGQKTVFRNKHNMYGGFGVAGKNVRHYGGAITCTAIFPRHIVRQSRDANIIGVEVYVSLSQQFPDLYR